MELLYIWVDGFRNFENIEFNFSNKHEIEYSVSTETISINKIKSHNIFGDNISNITGIIGKNSTGKSNLLELISIITKSKKSNLTFKFIALFGNNNDIFIYTNCTISNSNSFKSIENNDEFNNLNLAYFSNIQDDKTLNLPSLVLNLTRCDSIVKKKDYMINQFKFFLTDSFSKSDLESPDNLLISIRQGMSPRIVDRIRNIDRNTYRAINNKFNTALRTQNSNKHFRYSFYRSLFPYILNEIFNKINHNRININENKFAELELYLENFREIDYISIDELIEIIRQFIRDGFANDLLIDIFNEKDLSFLFELDNVIETLNPKLVKEGKYGLLRSHYSIELDYEARSIIRRYLPIFENIKFVELSWGGISSGHRAFINLFSQLYSINKKVNKKSNLLICIDEGDLYMHPTWQQEFLDRLITFITQIYFNTKIQIILTSHSPFLISDLPRRNIIYLDRTENKKCKVIPYNQSKEETFGANILDLYANSFFLKNGTISRFAYRKIKEIIEYLKHDTQKHMDYEMVLNTISLIGDDIIKFKLEKMAKDAKDNNYQ